MTTTKAAHTPGPWAFKAFSQSQWSGEHYRKAHTLEEAREKCRAEVANYPESAKVRLWIEDRAGNRIEDVAAIAKATGA